MAQPDTLRETVAVPIGELTITLRQPTDGQLAALRRIVNLAERADGGDKAAIGRAVEMFLDIADTLVTDDEILNRLYAAMAKEELDLSDYADALITALKHFIPDEEKTEGIRGTRRKATAGTGRRRG